MRRAEHNFLLQCAEIRHSILDLGVGELGENGFILPLPFLTASISSSRVSFLYFRIGSRLDAHHLGDPGARSSRASVTALAVGFVNRFTRRLSEAHGAGQTYCSSQHRQRPNRT